MNRRQFLQRTMFWSASAAAFNLHRPPGIAAADASQHVVTAGPLRVHPRNGRYLADATGRAVYLTGSHTWNNLSDVGVGDPPTPFDFNHYLDSLERHHHNFIRLWRWELTRWDAAATAQFTNRKELFGVAPHPWNRTGPGTAMDGKPRFNLDQFDQDYFERLRQRVRAAQARGVYVGIMLFEGWGLQHLPGAWQSHPFHPSNNIQEFDGDAGGDGRGLLTQTLKLPAVTRLQEAYVRHLIDTVNDLDNVLYEICNESGAYSTEWQYHLIRFIHAYEQGKPQQHPVGITFMYSDDRQQRGTNALLFNSPADWISPNPDAPGDYDYRTNPPPADGSKVIVSDTDHLWGIGGNADWVWKSFLRGHNPIFMDPYDNQVLGRPAAESWNPVRESMGHSRRLALRLDLASLTPREDLASSRYCLASPGRCYVVYLPEGGEVQVDLSSEHDPFAVEWIHPLTGETQKSKPVAGGGSRGLASPLTGPSVLIARRTT